MDATLLGRTVVFYGIVLCVGAVFGRLLPSRLGTDEDPDSRSGERLGRLGAGVLLLGLAALFASQLLEFRDPLAPLAGEARILLGTSWGRTWLAAGVGAGVACASFWMASAGRSRAWFIGAASVVPLAAFPALSGHAVASEDLQWIAVTADGLHVLAAGVWMGGLAWVLWRTRALHEPAPRAVTLVRAFSPWARAGALVLVVTGGFAVWLHVADLSALPRSPYGRWLILKLTLVALTMSLGWWNWRCATPRLGGTAADARAARRSMVLEWWVGFALVIAVTAALVNTSPS
ncbi:MAG: CopD family protein [Gemmatimonadota bacterium]